MPYLADGETWIDEHASHDNGGAENKPGHRKFTSYQLPAWCKHPIAHPFAGRLVSPQDYIYSAGDGFANPLGWTIGHVAAKYGDMDLLNMCTHQELSRPDVQGQTPASYAVQYGTPWCLQALVEKGADTTSAFSAGHSPEHMIQKCSGLLDPVEQEWCMQALRGELTEKNSVKAQEYRLQKHRARGNDPAVTTRLDQDMLKLRKYWFHTGEYEKPYPVPEQIQERRGLDLPVSYVKPPPKILPPLPVALLFPGQGSQYVGMLKDVMDKPAVKALLDVAEKVLGWNPRTLALNGPETKLEETRYCQPLMFIAGIAGTVLLRESKPEVVDRLQAVAGLSLGEYTALVTAGVLTFEDGLRLVKVRAEAMQHASELAPQAMCSVAGLKRDQVDKLCMEALAIDSSSHAECKVANWLFPAGFTCAGTKIAIDKLCELATASRALQARVIKTGGAFHTSLMKPAQAELSRAIDELTDRMRPPRCAIYFNVTGRKVPAGADPAVFVQLLKNQLTNEVLWEPSVKAMIMDGVQNFYEVGPLKQLKAMMKRIDPDAFKRMENISV